MIYFRLGNFQIAKPYLMFLGLPIYCFKSKEIFIHLGILYADPVKVSGCPVLFVVVVAVPPVIIWYCSQVFSIKIMWVLKALGYFSVFE